jgi:hypothetical protein
LLAEVNDRQVFKLQIRERIALSVCASIGGRA